MPANLRRHGYKGSINIDETGALTTFAPVASMNKWSISMKRERVDVTCFLDPNRVWAQGLSDVSGDLAGMWEALASRALLDVMMGDVAVGLKLVPSELDPTAFFSGLAYLDGGMDVAVDGAITLNGSYVAAGPWTLDPIGAGTFGFTPQDRIADLERQLAQLRTAA
jgi:hypothetical protein